MIIDSNEASQAPWILGAFPNATIAPLKIGDIASDDLSTIIERKSLDDLAASITDGRYRDQVRTLMETPSFIIIVGTKLNHRNARKYPMVHGAINSLIYKYRIPTFQVETDEEFVKLVEKIMDKRKDIDSLDLVIKRRHNDPQLELFCSIPGIGGKRATLLYEKYHSIYNLCHADPEEIADLNGLGPKTAATIIESLKNE